MSRRGRGGCGDVGDAVRVVGPRYVPRSTPVARSGDTAPLPLGRTRRSWGVVAIAGATAAGTLALGVGAGSVVGWTTLHGSSWSSPSGAARPVAAPGLAAVPLVGAPVVPAGPAVPVAERDDRPLLVSDTPGADAAPPTTTPTASTPSTTTPAATPPIRPVRQHPHARPAASPGVASPSSVGPTASPSAGPTASAAPSGPAATTTALPTVPTGAPAPGAG